MATQPSVQRVLSTRHIWLLTVGGFYAFFIFGFLDNLKGPTLPVLLRDLNFSYSQGGILLIRQGSRLSCCWRGPF